TRRATTQARGTSGRVTTTCRSSAEQPKPAGCGPFLRGGSVAARSRAWSSLGGIASTVLVVIGAMSLLDGPSDSSRAQMTAWYSSSSHRTHINIGWLLAGLGLPLPDLVRRGRARVDRRRRDR